MQEDIQIVVLVIVGTLLFLFLVGIIILSLLFYQRARNKHSQDMLALENSYQKELLQVELEVKEQTLHSISQEIHDNIGQVLSLAKLNLNTLNLPEAHPSGEKVDSTKGLVSKAIQDLRQLSHSLNSDQIGRSSLVQTLQAQLETIQKTEQFDSSFKLQGTEVPINPQRQLIVFRIAQEALNNIIKHSKASSITILLQYLPDTLVLSITDDGIGFDPITDTEGPKRSNGSGMGNMQHRAQLIHGDLHLKSRPGRGTRIQLSIPIHITAP